MSELERLVLLLEDIQLDTYLDDPEGLQEVMAERQGILRALEAADASSLEPQLRDELKQRLLAVQERDREVTKLMVERLNETRQQLEVASTSRRAMNGYRSLVSSEAPPPARRIG